MLGPVDHLEEFGLAEEKKNSFPVMPNAHW
jgi:hypothetical protein